MPNQKKKTKNQNQFNSYLRYSGLAFEMMGIIGGMTWLGYKLDEWTNTSSHVFLIVFALSGVVGAIIRIIYSLKDLSE